MLFFQLFSFSPLICDLDWVKEKMNTTDHPVAPVLLSVREVCALLGIHYNSCYQGLKTGSIPGLRRIGRALKCHRPTLEKWLETGELPPQPGRGR